MREPRWLRPATRLLFILAVTVWVTVSVAELMRAIAADPAPACPEKAADCPAGPPMWTLAIVGVLGVLSGWLAGRLTRPRVEGAERSGSI